MGKNGQRLQSQKQQKTNPFTKRNMIVFACIFILIFTALWLGNPELRVETFVLAFGDGIAEDLAAGNGVANNLFVKSFNTWEGEHTITEFILFTRGDTYYGCYYSADNSPAPFQNCGAELKQSAADLWQWRDGDNSGLTSRLFDSWFYFEASF